MGYCNDEDMVRVDLWKPSGKWYGSLALKWDRYMTNQKGEYGVETELIHETFRRCLKDQHPGYEGMRATCLEPYHEHSHPISIVIEEKQ